MTRIFGTQQTVMRILIILLFSVLVFAAQSQTPEAEKLLSSTLEKLKSDKGYEGAFSVKYFFGQELESEESGQIFAAGEKLSVDLTSIKYISDGKSSWTYLKDRNEVQINDVSEDDFSMFNPSVLLDHFFEGGYAYELTDKKLENEKEVSRIDFKPNDRESEIAKISVFILSEQKLPTEFILIQKDGSRYEIDIENIKINETVNHAALNFNPADYPDVIIEDLRLGD